MSNEALTWAFKQQLSNSSAKFVLVVLADHADENASCFPSQKKIARMTDLGERSVRRCLEMLERSELVTRSSRYGENGRRTTDRYRLNLAATLTAGQGGRPAPPAETTTGQIDQWSDSTGSTPANMTTGQNGRIPPPAETTTGQIDHRSSCPTSPANLAGQYPSVNPQSHEYIDGSATQTEPPPQTVIPSDFTLSEQMRAWAAKHTPALDPDEATEAFVDHYLSKGELRADWTAAWRSWMRTRSRWHAEKRQSPSASGFQPFRNPAEDDGDPNSWA